MIKERFCSYEVAKLLKEKGFNELVHYEYHYIVLTPQFHKKAHNFNGDEYTNCETDWFSAPTQQMACDWLKTKGILITYDLLSPFDNKFRIKVYRKDYDLDWAEATNTISENLEDYFEGYEDALVLFKQQFLDTLEVKEVNFEKVFIDEYSKFSNDVDAMDYAFPIDLADYKNFAKHFFELGLKAQKGE